MMNEMPDEERIRQRESLRTEYEIYLAAADDGQGGDITNDGKPLKSYDEWLTQ